MKNLTLDNIDKSNWKIFPFEKIAKRIAETVDPSKADLNIYYGLEHLDADSIHIRRNGTPSDVSGGKLKCYPGDVIFGKRRAYQRKAGIVTQPAICSAHAFVFRANEDIMDARLFPFFLHSDHFMHRMVDISVGGLSPTINWSDLKHQEFLLPPKAQQEELAELLWAMDLVIEKELVVADKLENYQSSSINNLINQNKKWLKFSEILSGKPQYGANESALEFTQNLPRYIRITDIDENGQLLEQDKKSVTSDYKIYGLNHDDILIARTGNTVGKYLIFKDHFEKSIFAGYLIRFVVDKAKYDVDFLSLFFKTDYYKNFIKASVKIGAQPNINAEQYSNMLLPAIDVDVQKQYVINNIELNSSLNKIKSKIGVSKELQRSIVNQLFGLN